MSRSLAYAPSNWIWGYWHGIKMRAYLRGGIHRNQFAYPSRVLLLACHTIVTEEVPEQAAELLRPSCGWSRLVKKSSSAAISVTSVSPWSKVCLCLRTSNSVYTMCAMVWRRWKSFLHCGELQRGKRSIFPPIAAAVSSPPDANLWTLKCHTLNLRGRRKSLHHFFTCYVE